MYLIFILIYIKIYIFSEILRIFYNIAVFLLKKCHYGDSKIIFFQKH